MMGIDKMENIIEPPNNPLYSGIVYSVLIDGKHLVELPSDFSQFIKRYGSGVIDDFIWILNPLSENDNISFCVSEYLIKSYFEMKKEFPCDYPRPEFPEGGSFLPFAITDNGESIVWIVNGNPDSWVVAVHGSAQDEEEVYDLSFIDFMVNFLSGKIASSIIPSVSLCREGHTFLKAEEER